MKKRLVLPTAALLGAAILSEACARSAASTVAAPTVPGERSVPPEPASAPAPPASPGFSSPEPGELVELEVPGHLPALLWVPAGDAQRPMVAAAHGAGGSPEWECEYWRRLVSDRAFVLCLRGTRMGDGAYYYKQHHVLGDELDRASQEARRRYPRIAPTSGIYAGFSQGASFGSLMIAERAAQFPYVVLIEGFVLWNVPLGRRFAARGGSAILWACGTRDCATKARGSASSVQRAGIRVQVDFTQGAGHTPGGPVMDGVRGRLSWLVEDDPLWTGTFDDTARGFP